MKRQKQNGDYRRPAITSIRAGEVIASMGPAHAIYGSTTGGGQGGDGGVIGD